MKASTRSARRHRILELLDEHEIRSQGELLEHLAAEGIDVTQATLSRDLVEIGAVKVRRGRTLAYAVPPADGLPAPSRSSIRPDDASDRLRRACEELLVTATPAQHLVVLRTPPGAANYLASTIDMSRDDRIVGTIAGDDTIMLVTASAAVARDVAVGLVGLTGQDARD